MPDLDELALVQLGRCTGGGPANHRPQDAAGSAEADPCRQARGQSITRQLKPSCVILSTASSGNQPSPFLLR